MNLQATSSLCAPLSQKSVIQLYRLEMAPLLSKHYWNEESLIWKKKPKSALELFYKQNAIVPVSGLCLKAIFLTGAAAHQMPNFRGCGCIHRIRSNEVS